MLVFSSISEGKRFISDVNNKKIIYDSLIEDIKDALIFDLTFVTIFRYEKEEMHHFLYKKDWINSLSSALDYYEYFENYEECIEIRDLITVIEDVFIDD